MRSCAIAGCQSCGPPNVPLFSCGRIQETITPPVEPTEPVVISPRATGRTQPVATRRGRQLQQLVGQQWNENGAKQDGERRATGSDGLEPEKG
jgi:hypothetical protein